jgi:hypothetical protein
MTETCGSNTLEYCATGMLGIEITPALVISRETTKPSLADVPRHRESGAGQSSQR